MRLSFLALLLLPSFALPAVVAIAPKSGPAPVGPYSPGVFVGDYLYVSGQGAKNAAGVVPPTFDAQARQALDNVKAIMEEAGLTMDNVVYTQVYLSDMSNFGEMNAVFKSYFPRSPPARATLGVSKLPGTPVEINAVAIRNASDKKVVAVAGYQSSEAASAGILTPDRLFVSGMRGLRPSNGQVPDDPTEQVKLAFDGMQAVVKAAGLQMANMVFVNPYLTKNFSASVMNKLYAERFEFGNTPARATIEVASLPQGAQIEFTGVAVRDITQRRAVRPKNMPPSPTASPCVFAGDTFYCSAKSGFIPGVNGGIFAGSIDQQLRQTMRNLLDNLEEAGLDFSNVVSANVYLDDLNEFQAMNNIYAMYFKGIPPVRTTIQQVDPVNRSANENAIFPTLEQISIIAVKDSAKH